MWYLANVLLFLDERTNRIDEGKAVEFCHLDTSQVLNQISHFRPEYGLGAFDAIGSARQRMMQFVKNRSFALPVGAYDP